ncbi:TSUP family transporter [Maritalea porphyrae]|uniref:TSUP family transporter n=1 Tax=Maritalea porphyrae TaxID=880732 RepID=UPI0022B029E3|nr:TSUP family transporter [Maritalea porphyrae]MCZ4271455.1 TSUP family transporter [Maritalea porphyrae]
MELDLFALLFLAGAGFLAAFLDAIAGGGGLISLPALLSVGVPPLSALATNKLQSVVGTTVAAITYWRRGFIQLKTLIMPVILTFLGSMIGAATAKSMDTDILTLLVPVLLIFVSLYFMFSPKMTDEARTERLAFAIFAPIMGFAIGFYDGVFGPGTGSFFIAGFVTLFGLGLTRAVGNTKVLNAVSNFAALMFFILGGDVVWLAGGAMIVGQIAGGYLGARTGMKFGASLIKPLIVVISMTMAIRLLWPIIFGA